MQACQTKYEFTFVQQVCGLTCVYYICAHGCTRTYLKMHLAVLKIMYECVVCAALLTYIRSTRACIEWTSTIMSLGRNVTKCLSILRVILGRLHERTTQKTPRPELEALGRSHTIPPSGLTARHSRTRRS